MVDLYNNDLSKSVGMQQKVVDISNIKKFGWSYKTPLIDGITKIYAFYLNEVLKK